jgi:hypothetical protein
LQHKENKVFGTEKSFDEKAIALAQEFKMDARDIVDAYKGKPESLTAHFNSVREAREDMGEYVGWSIFWGVVAFPVAVYPVWKLAEKYRALHGVEETVRDEIINFKANKMPSFGPSGS